MLLEDDVVLCEMGDGEVHYEVLRDGEMHVEHVASLLLLIWTVLHISVEKHSSLSILHHATPFVAALLATHQHKRHCSRRLARRLRLRRLRAAFQLGDKREATRVRKQCALVEQQFDAVCARIEPDTNRERGLICLFIDIQRERVQTPPKQVLRNIQQLDLVLQRKDIAIYKEGVRLEEQASHQNRSVLEIDSASVKHAVC